VKQKLKTKIVASLLLPQEKKSYWIMQIDDMPQKALLALEKAIDGYENKFAKHLEKKIGNDKNLMVQTFEAVADVAGDFKKYVIKNNG